MADPTDFSINMDVNESTAIPEKVDDKANEILKMMSGIQDRKKLMETLLKESQPIRIHNNKFIQENRIPYLSTLMIPEFSKIFGACSHMIDAHDLNTSREEEAGGEPKYDGGIKIKGSKDYLKTMYLIYHPNEKQMSGLQSDFVEYIEILAWLHKPKKVDKEKIEALIKQQQGTAALTRNQQDKAMMESPMTPENHAFGVAMIFVDTDTKNHNVSNYVYADLKLCQVVLDTNEKRTSERNDATSSEKSTVFSHNYMAGDCDFVMFEEPLCRFNNDEDMEGCYVTDRTNSPFNTLFLITNDLSFTALQISASLILNWFKMIKMNQRNADGDLSIPFDSQEEYEILTVFDTHELVPLLVYIFRKIACNIHIKEQLDLEYFRFNMKIGSNVPKKIVFNWELQNSASDKDNFTFCSVDIKSRLASLISYHFSETQTSLKTNDHQKEEPPKPKGKKYKGKKPKDDKENNDQVKNPVFFKVFSDKKFIDACLTFSKVFLRNKMTISDFIAHPETLRDKLQST